MNFGGIARKNFDDDYAGDKPHHFRQQIAGLPNFNFPTIGLPPAQLRERRLDLQRRSR